MDVVVSIALIKAREPISRYTVESLLNQKYLPDKIILNLSSMPYMLDEGFKADPYWIEQINSDKIQINWVENTGPYRKLLPALQEVHSEDLLITADDDIIYGENWLERLVRNAKEYPNEIICGRARKPKINVIGLTQSYINWQIITHGEVGMNLLPTGISGVVYRKNNLDLSFLFSEEYKNLSHSNDDPWFREASKRKSIPVRVVEGVDSECFPINHKVNLFNDNTQNRTSKKYPFVLKVFRLLIQKLKAYSGTQTVLNDKYIKEIANFSRKY